ncbi:hypothetical protein [Roseateles sp. P5_E8]
MHPSQSEALFRKQLRASGQLLKELSAEKALRTAVEFWSGTEFEGLRSDQGDGLVAYFELMDRGRGAQYEFGINRILRSATSPNADYEPWLPAHKLGLLVSFSPTLEVFQLKPAAVVFDVWAKEQSARFLAQVTQSAAFQVVAALEPRDAKIQFVEWAAPWGDPEHATKGLSWAIA